MSVKRIIFLLAKAYVLITLLCSIAALGFHLWTHVGLDNFNVSQMSLMDKFKFSYYYTVSYKLGIIGKREWDHKYLYRLVKHDPFLTKLMRGFQRKYGKVMVSDLPFFKVYIVLDPTFAVKLLKRDDKLGSGMFKEILFHSIMPTNIGVMRGKVRDLKRRFNENLFGTKRLNSLFGSIYPTLDEIIIRQPTHSSDFGVLALQVVGQLYLGEDTKRTRKAMRNFINFAKDITDISLRAVKYKFVHHTKEAQVLRDLVHEAMENNYKSANQDPSNIMTHVSRYKKQYNDGNEGDIGNEFPHWFVPLHNLIIDSIPHLLHIILSFPDIFNALEDEISDTNFDLYSRNTYLHFCVLEHLRLFNIINLNITRKVLQTVTVDGVTLHEGAEVLFVFSTILKNKDLFDQPDLFLPRRWEGKTFEEQNLLFGVGEQQCPSIQFSPFFIKCCIYVLLKKFPYQPLKHNIYSSREVLEKEFSFSLVN